jgi:antitoxin HicB
LAVATSLLTDLKIDLYRALRSSGLTRAELARRLDWSRTSVDRLFDTNHASRLEQIEAAMEILGFRIDARLVALETTA